MTSQITSDGSSMVIKLLEVDPTSRVQCHEQMLLLRDLPVPELRTENLEDINLCDVPDKHFMDLDSESEIYDYHQYEDTDSDCSRFSDKNGFRSDGNCGCDETTSSESSKRVLHKRRVKRKRTKRGINGGNDMNQRYEKLKQQYYSSTHEVGEAQSLHTAKGTLYHLNDGYYYCKSNVKDNAMYVKCSYKHCPMRGKLDVKSMLLELTEVSGHNHPPQKDRLLIEEVRSRIIQRCETESTDHSKIYKEEVLKYQDIADYLPYSSFLRTMQRKRQLKRNSPPRPVFRYDQLENILLDSNDDPEPNVPKRIGTNRGKLLTEDKHRTAISETTSDKKFVRSQSGKIDEDNKKDTAKMGEELSNMMVEEIILSELDDSDTDVDDNIENRGNRCSSRQAHSSEMEQFIAPAPCALCTVAKSIFTCIPCEHTCLCVKCRRTYEHTKCPECQREVTSIQRVLTMCTSRGIWYHENNGDFYTRTVLRGDKLYLRCHVISCRARGRTNSNLQEKIMMSPNTLHNHPSELWRLVLEKMKRTLLTRSENETTPLHQIYNEEVQKFPKSVVCRVSMHRMIRLMQIRRKLGLDDVIAHKRLRKKCSNSDEEDVKFFIEDNDAVYAVCPEDDDFIVIVEDSKDSDNNAEDFWSLILGE